MATLKSTYTSAKGLRALAARREPYWEAVAGYAGLSLGFRKLGEPGTTGGEDGTWVARLFDNGKYVFNSLDRIVDARNFPDADAASLACVKWLTDRKAGLRTTDITVKQICADYADAVEQGLPLKRKQLLEGARPTAAKALRKQHARWINGDVIGSMKVADLTDTDCAAWRVRLKKAAPNLSDASVNRELLCLRAPLNYAREIRKIVASDEAWENTLKKIKNADIPRDTYLNANDRKALYLAAPADLKPMIKILLLLPLRPGPAAALRVCDFNADLGTLFIRDDKTAKACNRTIVVAKKTAEFLAELCAGKSATDLIFTRTNGTPWLTREWVREFAKARDAAFPAGDARREACMYVLRHCSITDMVKAGERMANVAHVAGTSVSEIERTYLKHQPADSVGGLEKLAAAVNF